jgi:hypothetical protein
MDPRSSASLPIVLSKSAALSTHGPVGRTAVRAVRLRPQSAPAPGINTRQFMLRRDRFRPWRGPCPPGSVLARRRAKGGHAKSTASATSAAPAAAGPDVGFGEMVLRGYGPG